VIAAASGSLDPHVELRETLRIAQIRLRFAQSNLRADETTVDDKHFPATPLAWSFAVFRADVPAGAGRNLATPLDTERLSA
jgi:hypothetical protein